jgi:uncharacterized protein DUF3558
MADLWTKFVACVAASVLVFAAAGCSPPAAPVPGHGVPARAVPAAPAVTSTANPPATKRRLPPRPRDIDVTGLDPCQSLTEAQERQMHYDLGWQRPPRRETKPDDGVENCFFQWSSQGRVGIVAFPAQSPEKWLDVDPDLIAEPVRVITIDGFPAVRLPGPKALAQKQAACEVHVDVQDGHSIRVSAQVALASPPASVDTMCADAVTLATMVTKNAATGLIAKEPTYTVSTLPPRPRDIDLTDVDPCTLLTSAQLGELQYDPNVHSPMVDAITDSPTCAYVSPGRNVSAMVSTVRGERASDWLTDPQRHPFLPPKPITVAGFPALQVLPTPNARSLGGCVVVVDVHDGQYLMVQSTITDRYSDVVEPDPRPYCAEDETITEKVIDTLDG